MFQKPGFGCYPLTYRTERGNPQTPGMETINRRNSGRVSGADCREVGEGAGSDAREHAEATARPGAGTPAEPACCKKEEVSPLPRIGTSGSLTRFSGNRQPARLRTHVGMACRVRPGTMLRCTIRGRGAILPGSGVSGVSSQYLTDRKSPGCSPSSSTGRAARRCA